MKCDVIKDLLPSYVDGLTSEASNEEVIGHLETCADCRTVYGEMKQERTMPVDNEKEIRLNPFRKLRRNTRYAVISTLLCCMIAAGICIYLFAYGWAIPADEVTVSYSYDGTDILVDFELKSPGVLKVLSNLHGAIGENRLAFRKCLPSPLHNAEEPGKFQFGRNYMGEENGVLQPIPFEENDVLVLRFQNETQTLHWKDIAEELGVQ